MAIKTIELSIPSRPGFEKVAMAAAEATARLEGLGDKARDLATAVSESCLNAMEHGNGFNPCLPVKLTIRIRPGLLEVDVADAGTPFTLPSIEPSLRNKIEGYEEARGWGLYLIRNLVDKMEVRRLPEGNLLRLTVEIPGR